MIIQKQEEVQETKEEGFDQNREALVQAKRRIDAEITRLNNKELNDHARTIHRDLQEVTAALATIQDMVNLIWKRTEQMREELGALRGKTE